jgi:thiol-disulfide isomerase/thioredoxin
MKATVLLLGALLALAAPVATAQDKGVLQRFDGANGWLNSPPLGAPELRGKVVLVDFWTYSCINWLRTVPYVRAWAEKYRDQGLVVVGVHTPEFEFEKNVDNVRRAVRDMHIAYPVAVDSDYAVWRAFRNNAWPAIYLIDAQGRVRYRHLGEEEYPQTERMIQQLLAEAGKPVHGRDLVMPEGRGAEAAPDWASLRSPETYLGPERAENRVQTAPARLRLNQWTTSGRWTPTRQGLVSSKPHGRIAYRFHARDLHLVMGPSPGAAVRFRVLIDGQPPAAAHGADVDRQGHGTVTEQRLYQLIRQPKPIVERLFEIEFLDPAVEAFVFTFG